MNTIKIFQKVKDYLFENKINYNIELKANYIRVGSWERADDKLEIFLSSLGFKLCSDFDEDRGNLYSYCLDRKENYILLNNINGETVEANYYGIAESDEHKADEVIFICRDGSMLYQSDITILEVKNV
jgi:hypothetical protein